MSNQGHNNSNSDPVLAELQAVKQMISAMVLHQDRLLSRLSTQQETISRMQKQQDDMAFEIAELRRINSAQNDQLVMIRREMNHHWDSLKSHTLAVASPVCIHNPSENGHSHGNGAYVNGSDCSSQSPTVSHSTHVNGHGPQSPRSEGF